MSNRPVPPTHLPEPLEKMTEGRRYYVVDDYGQVWIANVPYEVAQRRKEVVAGNAWSKTPRIEEMPRGEAAAAVLRAARDHRASFTKSRDGDKSPAAPPVPKPGTNGDAMADLDEGDDEEIDSLLNA